DLKDSESQMLAMIIATAATDGIDAALREANSADPNLRRRLLGTAAQTMITLRYYNEAAAMFEQSVQGTPESAKMRGLIAALHNAKRSDELKLLGDDPKSLVLMVSINALKPGFDDDKAKVHTASFLNAAEDEAKAKDKYPEIPRPSAAASMRLVRVTAA